VTRLWRAHQEHAGRTFVLIGGGPSLKEVDVTQVKGRAVVITINNAIELAPWSDFHFFGDFRWWRWYGQVFPADYRGTLLTTSRANLNDGRVRRLERDYSRFSQDPNKVYGYDSGMLALNLAALLGAKKIVLLGYDMAFPNGESHWHPDHETPSDEDNYIKKFAPAYAPAVAHLQEARVQVVRCTPSNLSFIPQVSLEEALEPR